jgi:hypothetical protein
MLSFNRILAWGAAQTGSFRFGTMGFDLPSGRKFRYSLKDYPFSVTASEAELDALCCQVIKDKYRYCEWDRNHPKNNSEVEIFDAIKKWMVELLAEARKLQAGITQ